VTRVRARCKVCITLPAAALQALRARVAELQGRLDGGARLTEEGFLRYVLLLDLKHAAQRQEDAATKLLWQFDRVWRAVAAHAYKRCRGAVPIEDLQDAAREEALKACRKVNGKGSPAALIRVWASFGVKAKLKESISQAEFTLIYPDTDERSRWDVLADESAAPDARCGAREVSDRLQELVGDLPAWQRRALKLMERGSTDDEVAARTGQSAQAVVALRAEVARRLGLQLDEELGLSQAAELLCRSPASVVKMIQSGKLQGQRREGQWFLRTSDVMALVRLKEAA